MKVSSADFAVGVTLHRSVGRETLGIKRALDFPLTDFSRDLFNQFALMHVVAPYLPHVIETDFPVDGAVRDLIAAMYAAKDDRSDGKKPPDIRAPKGRMLVTPSDIYEVTFSRKKKAIVLHSAGKDSLWNVAWAQERFGSENVTAVHMGGLNRSNAKQEREFSIRQSEAIGFPLRMFELHNGSSNSGYGTMRSRDIFLVAVAVPIALQMGAEHIITEGFAEAKPTEPFSGLASSMHLFNETLAWMGIPVKVIWRDKPEMDIIADMYRTRPDWMEHMHNCFTIPYRRYGIRRSWARRAPSLPLHDSQCGSCVKCRLTIVGRILYDNELATTGDDVAAYLSSTVDWVREKYDKLADMIEGSFLRDLQRALALNGVEEPLDKLNALLAQKRK